MADQINTQTKIKNEECFFTELFNLLKQYDESSTGLATLAYGSDELKIIYQHIENAIAVLLQGLQGVGQLIGTAAPNKIKNAELNQLGFFISAISNLTEALNDLRSDADHVLQERSVMNIA